VKTKAGQTCGNITIDIEECKGCGLCVESCPPKCLEPAHRVFKYLEQAGWLEEEPGEIPC
jgi:ferredoxin